jgi:hypothetical protein
MIDIEHEETAFFIATLFTFQTASTFLATLDACTVADQRIT